MTGGQDAGARIARATQLIDLGRYAEALTELGPVLTAQPHHLAAGCLAAHALQRQGRASESVGLLRDLAGHWPESGAVREYLARAYTALGQHQAAVDCAARAVHLEPGLSGRHRQLARSLIAAGRRDEAIGAASEAVRLAPGVAAAHLVLSLALHPEGSRPSRQALAKAEEHVRIALQLEPGNAYAHNELARIRLAQGRALQAASHLVDAVGADPHDSAPQENMDLVFLRAVQWAHWSLAAECLLFVLIGVLVTDRLLANALAVLVVVTGLGWLGLRLRRAVPRHFRAFLRGFVRRDRLGALWAGIVAVLAAGLAVASVFDRRVIASVGALSFYGLMVASVLSWIRAARRR